MSSIQHIALQNESLMLNMKRFPLVKGARGIFPQMNSVISYYV